MQIKGRGGALTSAGRTVATLGRWTLDYTPEVMTLETALAAPPDLFWLDHGSQFVVALPYGQRGLRWRGVTVEREGDGLRITGGGKDNG